MPSNENVSLIKYNQIELGQPILFGHIMFKINNSALNRLKISEWATVHNLKSGYPPITESLVFECYKLMKDTRTKFESIKYEQIAHEYTALNPQTFQVSTASTSPFKCEIDDNPSSLVDLIYKEPIELESKALLAKLELNTNSIKKEVEVLTEKLQKRKRTKKNIGYVTTRKLFYLGLMHNVARKNIPSLMNDLYKCLFIKAFPFSRTTTCRMTWELSFLSDIKTFDAVVHSNNVTIIFDTVTQDSVHVNCLMLETGDSSFVVNIEQLTDETTQDYFSYITTSFDRLVKNYVTATGEVYEDCFKELLAKITYCLTDKATVNETTIFLLEQKWEKSLIELNCNIHPLEAVTAAVCRNLYCMETSHARSIFSTNNCLVYDIIINMDSLRYSHSKENSDFQTALSNIEKNVPTTRFWGNRINVIFLIGYQYFMHKDIFVGLLKFLSEDLAKSVGFAFRDDEAIIELQVIAILFKLFSEPWISKFYTSLKEPQTIDDGIDTVKCVVGKIVKQLDDPMGVLNCTSDFFEDCLDLDQLNRERLFQMPTDCKVFSSMMKTGLQAIIDVLQHQYDEQFKYYDDLRVVALNSASQHTMEIKRICSGFWSMKKSSSYYISMNNLAKAKRNKLEDVFCCTMINKIIRKSIPHARLTQKRHLRKEEDIESEET